MSTTQLFLLPDLGEGLPDAEIVEWHVAVGQVVRLDDPLVSMETAKAVVDVPAPCSGTLLRVAGKAGDVITTGTPPGVGLGMKPPRYLKSDDEMVLRIDGLGEQRQRVVAFDDWTAKVAAGEPTN